MYFFKKGVYFLLAIVLIYFFYSPKVIFACDTTNAQRSVISSTCERTTCDSNISQAFVQYDYPDQTFCRQIEYFSSADCQPDTNTTYTCTSSCTSKNDCTGIGVCANPDIGYFGSEQNAITSICSGTDLGPGPKACMIIGCGYQCNTSSYSCNRSYAIDSIFGTNFPGYLKPFEDLSSCQSACKALTPTPTPPPAGRLTPIKISQIAITSKR